ncbi:MAG: hypothetical protein K6T86_20380, partial [Pirellulales bacterium]|nr:hypothetical protein [Pirellulales bacterium]
ADLESALLRSSTRVPGGDPKTDYETIADLRNALANNLKGAVEQLKVGPLAILWSSPTCRTRWGYR